MLLGESNVERRSLGSVVIDYLQLIQPDNANDPRQEQVAKIARRLKGLAANSRSRSCVCRSSTVKRKTRVTIDPSLAICVSQARSSRTPMWSCLCIAKAIFKKARPEEEVNEHEALIIVEKQRNGPPETWNCTGNETSPDSPTGLPSGTASSTISRKSPRFEPFPYDTFLASRFLR